MPAPPTTTSFKIQVAIVLILFFSVLSTSCRSQIQTNESEVILPMRSVQKDPLFFIEGQLCQHLRRITQDKNGHLWFGTNVYGLMCYNSDKLLYYNRNGGHDYGRITGFVHDKDSSMWFTSYQGLTRYDGHTFTNFTEEHGLRTNESWCLAIDRKGLFWIGTNDGVSCFNGSRFTDFMIPKALVIEPNTLFAEDRIVSIVEDKQGNLWFGTDGFGLVRFDGTSFTHYTTENGLCDNAIHELMIDSKGNIWIGTFFGGVSMFDGKTFTNFTANGVITGEEVCGFFQDKKGNIWFAAENHGVYCYNGTSFVNYREKDGLITNGILSIFEDREGRFWFGGWGGLFRFDEGSFIPVAAQGPWEK